MELAIIFASFIILLVLGFPVAFTLLSISMVFGLLLVGPRELEAVYATTFRYAMSPLFVAVPLFVFMANLLRLSGIIADVYDMMYKWAGGLRGSLALATVGASTLIASMSGVAATEVLTLGLLAIREMQRRGYSKSISLGCIVGGGALGPIIPPSVMMVIVGGFANIPIGSLFMGGVIPGLLMALSFVVYIVIRCYLQPHIAPAIPPHERPSWREKLLSLRKLILPALIIFSVLGSIYGGVATVSEAAAVGALFVFLLCLARRQLNWEQLREALVSTARVTCMAIWLGIGGGSLTVLLSMTGITKEIVEAVTGLGFSPFLMAIMMQSLGLIMGLFMDGVAITMILIPLYMPVVQTLGLDPLLFTLLFSINMVIGYVTPPFGMNLFYLRGVAPPDVSMKDIYLSVIPYVIIMIAILFLLMVFPSIALWLPRMMG